jgi:hypothetical protein
LEHIRRKPTVSKKAAPQKEDAEENFTNETANATISSPHDSGLGDRDDNVRELLDNLVVAHRSLAAMIEQLARNQQVSIGIHKCANNT